MFPADLRLTGQVCKRACSFQDFVVDTGGKMQTAVGLQKERFRLLAQPAVLPDHGRCQRSVAGYREPAVTLPLNVTGLLHPRPDFGGRLRAALLEQVLFRRRFQGNLQVNSVQQCSGQAVEIGADLSVRTGAAVPGGSPVSAGTRIHSPDKQKMTGIDGDAGTPGQTDDAFLQRLEKTVQHRAGEQRQLIEKQDSRLTMKQLLNRKI